MTEKEVEKIISKLNKIHHEIASRNRLQLPTYLVEQAMLELRQTIHRPENKIHFSKKQ